MASGVFITYWISPVAGDFIDSISFIFNRNPLWELLYIYIHFINEEIEV